MGFTLVELLLVIGVVVILSTVLLTVVNPIEQLQKARDARRKSDLAQVQRALEAYYQDNERYPEHNPSGSVNSYKIKKDGGGLASWGQPWQPYMSRLPGDSSTNYVYYARSDRQAYWLYASLERGGKDPQACNSDGSACASLSGNSISAGACQLSCILAGSSGCLICNYGVSSPNVSP